MNQHIQSVEQQIVFRSAVIAALVVLIFAYGTRPALAVKKDKNTPEKTVVTEQVETIEGVVDSAARVALDTKTLKKGFTIQTGLDIFRIGVTPNSLGKRKKARVALKLVPVDSVELGDETLLSNIYSFDIFNKNTIEVHKPIWLSIAWTTPTQKDYVLKYWSSNDSTWIEIPSTTNTDEQRVQAAIHLPFATVAIFEGSAQTYEGGASWYDWHGAAMNEPPMGSDVIVTNVANGKEVRTTIVSRGPFIPGRVIDLPREVFAALDDVWKGVINVSVRTVQ